MVNTCLKKTTKIKRNIGLLSHFHFENKFVFSNFGIKLELDVIHLLIRDFKSQNSYFPDIILFQTDTAIFLFRKLTH